MYEKCMKICKKYDKYDINMQEIFKKYARNMH
jgi:hypothetical protein